MTHLVALRLEVPDVLRVGIALERNPLDDLEPVTLQAGALRWVVGQQSHRRDAEVHEYLGSHSVVSGVRRETELDISLDGVEAPILKRVRLELVPQADAPA